MKPVQLDVGVMHFIPFEQGGPSRQFAFRQQRGCHLFPRGSLIDDG